MGTCALCVTSQLLTILRCVSRSAPAPVSSQALTAGPGRSARRHSHCNGWAIHPSPTLAVAEPCSSIKSIPRLDTPLHPVHCSSETLITHATPICLPVRRVAHLLPRHHLIDISQSPSSSIASRHFAALALRSYESNRLAAALSAPAHVGHWLVLTQTSIGPFHSLPSLQLTAQPQR